MIELDSQWAIMKALERVIEMDSMKEIERDLRWGSSWEKGRVGRCYCEVKPLLLVIESRKLAGSEVTRLQVGSAT